MEENSLKIEVMKMGSKLGVEYTQQECTAFKDFKEMTDKIKDFPCSKEVIKEIGDKTQGNFCKSFIVKDDKDETSLIKYTLTFDFSKENTNQSLKQQQQINNKDKRKQQKQNALEEAKAYLKQLVESTTDRRKVAEQIVSLPILGYFSRGKTIFLSKSGRLRGETPNFVHLNRITGEYYFFNHHNGIVDLDNLKESKNIKSLKPITLSSCPLQQVRAVGRFFQAKANEINATEYTKTDLKQWLDKQGFKGESLVEFICTFPSKIAGLREADIINNDK